MDFRTGLRHIWAMNRDHDVIVAGGGLNGPALALALAEAGLTVAVIDPRRADLRAGEAFDGRAYALALASQRLLAALGLWRGLAGLAQPILGIRTSDGVPPAGSVPFFLGFDHGELDEGAMGYMLEDRHLYTAVLAAMEAEPRITLIDGQGVVAQEVSPGGVVAVLSDGRRVAGRVLVGCDGRGSGVAARAGIRRTGWGYGQVALVGAIRPERPHDGIAHQVFLPAGPVAILPLTEGRASIVWSEGEASAAAIAAMPDADYAAVLEARIGHITGRVTLAGPRFSYPLSLSLAETYVAPRVALVGDAAHGVHPIAGQGLNLGLRDVAALAQVLAEARRRGEDIGAPDVLERYQRWRRFDATVLALGMDTVNRLFSNGNPVLRAVRGMGMRAVAALPGARRGFIREAAGLSGEVPRLLTGQRV